ncbi:MAG: enolase C-terminal domain-like protein, partial [Pseudonocardiaceae bacterium]
RTIEELATVRRKVTVPIAADESIRRAEDPLRVAVAAAADIAVIKCTPLGGVRRSLDRDSKGDVWRAGLTSDHGGCKLETRIVAD